MSDYDRRPLRDWERDDRPSPVRQVGSLRLLGFIGILAGSFLVLNHFGDDPVATTPTVPRVAVDSALAAPVRAALPRATLTTGPSAGLTERIRGDLVVDLAILDERQAEPLLDQEQCSSGAVVASRGTTRYLACDVNASGSSRALATQARRALNTLTVRNALIDAGFDVPQAGDDATTP